VAFDAVEESLFDFECEARGHLFVENVVVVVKIAVVEDDDEAYAAAVDDGGYCYLFDSAVVVVVVMMVNDELNVGSHLDGLPRVVQCLRVDAVT
jgi:hypothetical protein